MMKVETYKGITTEKRVKIAGKKLHKAPRRKKPKFDFAEGIRAGILSGSLMVLEEALAKSFSGSFVTPYVIFKARTALKSLVEEFSYSPKEIYEIMTGTGIKNPEFMLEYVMKGSTCEVKGCPVILTNFTMIKNFKCTRHSEGEK